MSATELTLDEKRRFLEDGFIVIREAVPRELTFRARRAVNMHAAREGVRRPYHDLAGDSPLPDLVNMSRLGEIMRNTMGPYDPPRSAFAAILYPQPETKVPNYGWQPHVDGMWYSARHPEDRGRGRFLGSAAYPPLRQGRRDRDGRQQDAVLPGSGLHAGTRQLHRFRRRSSH